MSMTAVGLTSRWIAASRAMETEGAEPLFSDPFARDLAGEPGFAMMAAMRQAMAVAHFTGPDPYLSIRTKFLDDAVLTAVRDTSLGQVVILAAGMDARAFRLDWPDGVVLFEVDRDEVFEHKEPVLERLDARARCDRRIVRADVSGPWPDALAAAGFDAASPAAILVEGLFFYLDEATATGVLRALGALACEGSWIGMDLVNTEMLTSPYLKPYLSKLRELGCPWLFGVSDPERVLAEQGWQGTVVAPGEPAANFGRWIFAPSTQLPWLRHETGYVLVRKRTGTEALVADLASIVRELEPDAPIGAIEPMDDMVANTLVRDRLYSTALVIFAVVAVLLAAFGIYGAVTSALAVRTREMGVRLALGAS